MKLLKYTVNIIVISFFTILTITCCSTKSDSKKLEKAHLDKHISKKIYKLVDKNNKPELLGDSISFNISKQKKIIPDSVIVSINGHLLKAITTDKNIYRFSTKALTVGQKDFSIKIYYSDSLMENHSLRKLIVAKNPPKDIKYKVLRKLKHDAYAYTQGLIYDDGILYESTGLENRSSIRAINPKDGEIIKKRELEPQYFGEGIAIFSDNIYMLTYKARKGFIFNKTDFELIRQFELQTPEGWGLTIHESDLILSDGSAYLYYYDPEYFSLEKQIEVCDNIGIINNLNELEYTQYGIFANVYTKDYIVLINPETGEVTGQINFKELYPEEMPKDIHHVLNGIAFNSKKNTFYITGKQWPVIYEVELTLD